MIKEWAKAILADLCITGGFILSLVMNYETAITVYVFAMWWMCCMGIVVGFFCIASDIYPDKSKKNIRLIRSTPFKVYRAITELVLLVALVAFGYSWLASARILSILFVSTYMYRTPKEKEQK